MVRLSKRIAPAFLILGIAVSIGASWHIYRLESAEISSQFQREVDQASTNIEQVLPEDNLRGFKGQYLETAKLLRDGSPGVPSGSGSENPADQLDFEFVLFASAVIDYDYIMGLISRFSQQKPGKSKMTREELMGLISADAKFIHERDDIATCLSSLDSLITAETQQLEALKTHKRGLMQQLFPSPEEVEG